MIQRSRSRQTASAVMLDLQALSDRLGGLLPTLLFTRDSEVLVRWCRARSQVDNALSGDLLPDLLELASSVARVALRVSD